MIKQTLFILSIFLFCEIVFGFTSKSLKVKFQHGGVLIGKHKITVNGRHVRAFTGIPYAKPPVGELRFKDPEPLPPWEGEKLAIHVAPICPQIDPFTRQSFPVGEEDCLYLNVYTPPLKDIEVIGKLPVMVQVHGGGFEAGYGGESSRGPEYLLEENIVLVSGNYRLAALGFLSTETLDCPGNFGLKDNVEILKWVQKYISLFGGDPDSVTIFGTSAGGAIVNYLMQSKLSKGLFHKAIIQSGFIYNPWSQPMHKGEAAKKAFQLAKGFNCENEHEDWEDMIECLKSIPSLNITLKFPDFFEWDIHPIVPFQPVIEPKYDAAFLNEYPRDADMGSLNIPVMTGITSSEGLLTTPYILNHQKMIDELKKNAKKLFPVIFQYNNWSESHQNRITKEIERFYFKNGHDYDLKNHQNFTNLHSDSFFNAGFDEFLEIRLKLDSAPTFVYIFNHRSEASMSEVFGGEDVYYGVCHGDEVPFLFSSGEFSFPTSIPSDKDILMRNALVKMWANFAKFGNPTPSGGALPKWKAAQGYPWNYARIGNTNPGDWYILENKENYTLDRFNFWKKLKPHVHFIKGDQGNR